MNRLKHATSRSQCRYATLADVQARLGEVPYHRILVHPAPGTATERDLFDNALTGHRICDLVDGILVERTMGFREASLSARIIHLIGVHVAQGNFGGLSGAKGPIRLREGLVRLPDVAFVRWDSVEDTDEIEHPKSGFLEVPPDLAIEVLSPSNTPKEMAIKLDEYARVGVKLVWYVDPDAKEVTVFPKGRERGKRVFGVDGTLDGGNVLPGFKLPVARIFEDRAPPRRKS